MLQFYFTGLYRGLTEDVLARKSDISFANITLKRYSHCFVMELCQRQTRGEFLAENQLLGHFSGVFQNDRRETSCGNAKFIH